MSNINIILILLILCGCGLSEEEIVQMATEEFERKAQLYRQEQRLLCNKAAILEAERQADSIIFEMKINPLKTDLYRPEVPPKPSYVPTDSTVINSKESVKPILDSTRFNK